VYASERINHEIMEMNKRRQSGSKAAKARWKKQTQETKEDSP